MRALGNVWWLGFVGILVSLGEHTLGLLPMLRSRALLGLQKNYVKQPIECPENKLQSRGRAEMQRILSSLQKLPEEKNPHIYATLI